MQKIWDNEIFSKLNAGNPNNLKCSQYRNDAIQLKNFLILKLPPFSVTYTVKEKGGNFKHKKFFSWVASSVYWLSFRNLKNLDIFVQPRKKHLKLEKICSFFFNEKTINSPQSDNLLSCKVFYPDIILNLIHIALLHENAIRGNSGIRIKNRVRNSELFTLIKPSIEMSKRWNSTINMMQT